LKMSRGSMLRIRYGSPYLYLESPSYLFEVSQDGGATWSPCEQWEADDIMIEIRGEVRHDCLRI
jgi:hypothetical protein